MFSRISAGAILLVSVAAIPLVAVASNLGTDQAFRDCMRQATNVHESRLIDLSANHCTNTTNIMTERQHRYLDAWTITHDKTRNQVLRDINNDINNRLRDLDKFFRNDQHNIDNDFRNDQRACENDQRDRFRNGHPVPPFGIDP